MRSINYEVLPRYTGGSPAMVGEDIAERVARQERQAFKSALEGIYGLEEQQVATAQGLDGIVLVSHAGAPVNVYHDYITERDYGKMPYTAIRHYEQITILRVRGASLVYFRRALMTELPGRKTTGTDFAVMGIVLRLLHQKYGVEMYSAEAEQLWKGRVEC